MVRIVGRVVGTTSLALLVSGLFLGTGYVVGQEKGKTAVDAKTAFARLKTMAGTWQNKLEGAGKDHHGGDDKVIYHLTGAGSALVETDFPGSDHEMVSVYHLDGDDLRMTHY